MIKVSMRISVAAVLLLGAGAVRAEAPEGAFELTGIGGPDSIIIARSTNDDPEEECVDVEDLGRTCNDYSDRLTIDDIDGRGKVTGFGTYSFFSSSREGTFEGTLTGSVNGTLKRSGGDALLSLKGTLDGDVKVPGIAALVPGKLVRTLKYRIHEDGTYEGTEKVTFKVKPLGTQSGGGPVTGQYEGPFTWNLRLDLTPESEKTLVGSAQVQLDADDSTLQFDVKGKYNAKKDEATLTLVPLDGSEGASIKLIKVHAPGDGTLSAGQVKYKLLGQGGVLENQELVEE